MDWIKIKNNSDHPELISARSLQFTIGFLGFLFPVALMIVAVVLDDCEKVQHSISAYYHTDARNLFVGVLCAIALCLFAYKGYSYIDNLAGNLAAIFALGVAFFPTSIHEPFTICLNKIIDLGLIGDLHLFSAAFLFLCFSFFSMFLFTKSKGKKDRTKIIKNRIHRGCSVVMLVNILLIAIYFSLNNSLLVGWSAWKPVFWLESFALWAFSISWLVKSEYFHR
jgi:hypothetical protein